MTSDAEIQFNILSFSYKVKKLQHVSVSFVRKRKKSSKKKVEFAESSDFTMPYDRFRD